jgi:hypothetical protein
MNFFSIFAMLLPYAEEIGPHAGNIFKILLPVIPQILANIFGTSFKIFGTTISAYSATGEPQKVNLSVIEHGLAAYVAGEQAQVQIGDTIITVTPHGMTPTPPAIA